MKFIVCLAIAVKAVKIQTSESPYLCEPLTQEPKADDVYPYVCSPIESGLEDLVINSDEKEAIVWKPLEGLEKEKMLEEGNEIIGAEDEIEFEKKEFEVLELEVLDLDGEKVTLTVYPGLLEQPMRYQEFNKQGFLSDEQGNLVDLDDQLLVSAQELATLINMQKRGAVFEMPQGVMVAIMFEEDDEIKEEPETGIFELDPTIELEEGESQACQGCSQNFGFRFDDLWGGQSSCHQAPVCHCQQCQQKVQRCHQAPVCQPKCEITTKIYKGDVAHTCSKKCIVEQVPVARCREVPYIVEVAERVPVYKTVRVPVHVPVKIPIKVPVYVKQYVPNYIKKDVIVKKNIYKTITKVVKVDKPIICETVKKVCVEVPVYKKQIVPVVQTTCIEMPYPVVECQSCPVKCGCQAVQQCECQYKHQQVCECQQAPVCDHHHHQCDCHHHQGNFQHQKCDCHHQKCDCHHQKQDYHHQKCDCHHQKQDCHHQKHDCYLPNYY